MSESGEDYTSVTPKEAALATRLQAAEELADTYCAKHMESELALQACEKERDEERRLRHEARKTAIEVSARCDERLEKVREVAEWAEEEKRVELGTEATVVMDSETHSPTRLNWEQRGLRTIGVRDAEDLHESSEWDREPLVDEIPVVSIYSLHVALYALQNPTPENIRQALYSIGTSGDCEEWVDHDTLFPLPVPEPPGWDRFKPEGIRS